MVEQFPFQGSEALMHPIAIDRWRRLLVFVLSCYVTDIPRLRAALEEVECRLGPVRVLVNNAASDDRHDFAQVTRRSIGIGTR